MARHSYITDLKSLKTWFIGLGYPKWNLYRGHQERKNNSSMIYKQDDGSLAMDDSWELLRNMIEMNSVAGGQFTVYVPTVAGGNQGMSVLVGINVPTASSRMGAAVSGIPAMGMIPAAQAQKDLERERQIWEMEKRIEDMEAAGEAGIGFQDILKEQLRDIELGPIINGLVHYFMQKTPGVQLQGTPGDETPEQPSEGPPVYAYDGKRLRPALDTIRPHFDNDDQFYGFLEVVAQAFAMAPQQFKSQFGYE